MTSSSRISELASIIKDRTTEIDQYLESNGHPSPSLSIDALPKLPISGALLAAQDDISVACTELQALIEGPLEHLLNIMVSIQAIVRKDLAGCVPVGEEITYADLAKKADMDEDHVRRLVRMAISNHIFVEPRKGVVAHSAISKLMAQDELVRHWVGLVTDEMWPIIPFSLPAMLKWPGSQEPNETAFVLSNPTGEGFWDAIRNDPKRAQRFADGMKFLQSHPAFDVNHLHNSLEWDGPDCPSVMVDIGGSQGSIAISLLRRYPKLQCHVQDIQEVIQGSSVPYDLRGRLHFVSHNFFTEQPLKGADVYYLRSILHDWSDKYARQIIRNLVPALKDGAKVIVNEICVPEPNTLPSHHAQFLHGYDLAMCQNYNSKERDAGEWAKLFQDADLGFQLNRIVSSPGSLLSVIEFVWGPCDTPRPESVDK